MQTLTVQSVMRDGGLPRNTTVIQGTRVLTHNEVHKIQANVAQVEGNGLETIVN